MVLAALYNRKEATTLQIRKKTTFIAASADLNANNDSDFG